MRPCRTCRVHGAHARGCPAAAQQPPKPDGPPRAPAPEPPPRLTGKVLGFRSWHLDGHRLGSANRNFAAEWSLDAPTTAQCRRDRVAGGLCVTGDHVAPDPSCACGLYAYHDLDAAADGPWLGASTSELVFGAVLGWGRLEVHAAGWRGEHAQPIVLAYGDAQPYRHVLDVQAWAAEFDLPLVELSELHAAAEPHGQPIPVGLRPRDLSEAVRLFARHLDRMTQCMATLSPALRHLQPPPASVPALRR